MSLDSQARRRRTCQTSQAQVWDPAEGTNCCNMACCGRKEAVLQAEECCIRAWELGGRAASSTGDIGSIPPQALAILKPGNSEAMGKSSETPRTTMIARRSCFTFSADSSTCSRLILTVSRAASCCCSCITVAAGWASAASSSLCTACAFLAPPAPRCCLQHICHPSSSPPPEGGPAWRPARPARHAPWPPPQAALRSPCSAHTS